MSRGSLRLAERTSVVNVDGGDHKLASLVELVEVVNSSGGLLRDTADVCSRAHQFPCLPASTK